MLARRKIIGLFLVQEITRIIGELSSRGINARLEILDMDIFLSVCVGLAHERDIGWMLSVILPRD
jgi:hypothetical protein